MSLPLEPAERRAATPRAGAIAGILFAVLFGVSLILIATSLQEATSDTGEWLRHDKGRFTFAVALLPFAGVFFLWFMAVARARLGRAEDRFFDTVMLGSGLLFLAMVFAAAAVGGAIVATYDAAPSTFTSTETYRLGRNIVAQIFSIYALRMAAVFLFAQATMWLRLGIMPRWASFATYALGLVLLLTFSQSALVVMIFPAWVFAVSLYILLVNMRRQEPAGIL